MPVPGNQYESKPSTMGPESTNPPDFRILDDDVGIGSPPDAQWLPLADQPLLILVGLTGVGKSTTVRHLQQMVPALLLPNRRTLTDHLIISHLQELDGRPHTPVTDREERFAMTRRYRSLFPGGMAHALSKLLMRVESPRARLIFDGLRGAPEVAAATTLLPHARFVILDAPDVVRVQRLLGRADVFDQVTAPPKRGPLPTRAGAPPAASPLLARGIILPDSPFTAAEETELAALLDTGIAPADLQAKLTIVAAERRNYDAGETTRTLTKLAAHRTLYLDTTKATPAACAAQITQFWTTGDAEQ